MTWIEVRYTTADGVERRQSFTVADHPILSINALWIGKRKIPIRNCRMQATCKYCGELMDISGSVRPGARLAHNTCMERFKKRRYRAKHQKDLP